MGSRPAANADPCEHTEGVYIVREEEGMCSARCLACGEVGSPREDFAAALRDLQESKGEAKG